jgi:hypothetical protein
VIWKRTSSNVNSRRDTSFPSSFTLCFAFYFTLILIQGSPFYYTTLFTFSTQFLSIFTYFFLLSLFLFVFVLLYLYNVFFLPAFLLYFLTSPISYHNFFLFSYSSSLLYFSPIFFLNLFFFNHLMYCSPPYFAPFTHFFQKHGTAELAAVRPFFMVLGLERQDSQVCCDDWPM